GRGSGACRGSPGGGCEEWHGFRPGGKWRESGEGGTACESGGEKVEPSGCFYLSARHAGGGFRHGGTSPFDSDGRLLAGGGDWHRAGPFRDGFDRPQADG